MVDSVFPALEPLLAGVTKPVQYVGGEVNSISGDWEATDVRWVLLYLDVYEVGAPNQGIQILYEVLNEREGVLAERAYAVWPDLEAAMRDAGIPAFSVDSHRPLAAFDVLGVSLATELGHTNLLSMLDLAGIPLHAAERGPGDPLVIAGGHAAFNPEPLACFLDGVILGDGEEAVGAVSSVIRDWKHQREPGGRDGLLAKLAGTGHVYVPRFYDVDYAEDGRIVAIKPNRPGVPWRVSKHVVTDLDNWPYPRAPIVPVAETVHERMSVEIFRGCTRGCRFCQAGMVTRPVRERSAGVLAEMASCGLRSTGYAEVGLLSLSSADHSQIGPLVKGLADTYSQSRTALSLPSTRVDAFNIALAQEVSRNGRRSGLTFAPEGGSERLRRVINKKVTEADLIETVTAAFASGWRHVKLYFMCGLPTETDDDVLQIARLVTEVIRVGRQVTGRRDISCTLSVGGFVPKPHTPFQWAGQLPHEETDRRLGLLRDRIRSEPAFSRAIKFRYHDGRPGTVEGLLARGDRRVGAVIEGVWRQGGRFDGWSEYFSFDRWCRAAEDVWAGSPLSLDWYTTREREHDEVLPWSHLDAGLDQDWLWQEWLDASSEDELGDCRWTPCTSCGVCDQLGVDIDLASRRAGGRAVGLVDVCG